MKRFILAAVATVAFVGFSSAQAANFPWHRHHHHGGGWHHGHHHHHGGWHHGHH